MTKILQVVGIHCHPMWKHRGRVFQIEIRKKIAFRTGITSRSTQLAVRVHSQQQPKLANPACQIMSAISATISPTPIAFTAGTGNNKMSSISRPTRYSSLSLKDVVCLCAGPCDEAAWEEFVSRVGKSISLAIMRTAALWGQASQSVVEDLVQVTYVKLWEDGCRLLRDSAIQHPEAISGYLKKTAANVLHTTISSTAILNRRVALACNSSVGFIRTPLLAGCDLGWPYSSIKRVCFEAHSH